MKIIKYGYINRQITCASCGCIYEYDSYDIHKEYFITGTSSYVCCPCCGKKEYVWNNYEPIQPYGITCDIGQPSSVLNNYKKADTALNITVSSDFR